MSKKSIETTYFVYNKGVIPLIGTGLRKIHVTEKRKWAYIRDNHQRKTKMRMVGWERLKEAECVLVTRDGLEDWNESCRCKKKRCKICNKKEK